MDDWNDLRLVLAVERDGSLRAAAAELGMDHSPICHLQTHRSQRALAQRTLSNVVLLFDWHTCHCMKVLPVHRLIVGHTDCINRLKIRPVRVAEVESLPPCTPELFDAAVLLEGLSQAVARLLRGRSLQRDSAAERVSFNTLNRKTGNRLKQNMVDSVTEEPVDPSDRVKGYQVSKGQYVMVEDDDMEALKIESTKLIEIEAFVPAVGGRPDLSRQRLLPRARRPVAEEAFAVIRDAMAAKEVVGIGRVVLNRRERMLMLPPRGKGILATTLRYPYEVRQDAEYFSDIADMKLPDDMMGIAEVIIERKSGHFEPDKFTDRYEEAVVSMLRAKQAGQSFAVPETPAPSKVVNIMDALKRSLEAEGGGAPSAGRARRARSRQARRSAGREEAARKPKANKPLRARRRAEGAAERHRSAAPALRRTDAVPGRAHAWRHAPAARPAGAPARRQARDQAAARASVYRRRPLRRVGRAPRWARADAGRAAFFCAADQRNELRRAARAVRRAPERSTAASAAPRSSASPASRRRSSPALCCSMCWSRWTIATPIATWWRRAKRRGCLKRSVALAYILEASIALRRRGSHLAETRLAEGPSGELLRELSGQLAELSGQFNMPLEQQCRAASTTWWPRPRRRKSAATTPPPRRSMPLPCARFGRPGPPLQPRQRVRRARPRGRRQDRLADRGRARSGVRGSLVQPRHRGGG